MIIPMLTETVLRPVGLVLAGMGCLVLIMALLVFEACRTRCGHRSVFEVVDDIERSER